MMIIKMEGVKKTKDTGSKDDAAKKQTGTDVSEIKLEDLHFELDENFHVLAIGDAGEGKTSTVKRYIELFLSDSKQAQGKFKLVLYIQFSEIGTEKTTAFDLLISKPVGDLEERLEKVGKKWFKAHSNEVLIALDGMDQSKISFKESYPSIKQDECAEPATIMANIASGHIYNGMKIISTSRWHTFWDLGENFKPGRIVALRGFSHEQVKDVFKQVLRSKADDALKHLEENAPGLLSLCSTPNILLNTASVLSLPKENWPETETGIMVFLISHLLRSKRRQNQDEDFVANLSALAYYGLKNGIYMFSKKNLKDHNLEMSRLQDFMKTDADLFPGQIEVDEMDKRCSYIHQTWQEAFAATHVCLNAEKFQSQLGAIVWKPEMEKFGVFLFGILGHKPTAEMVQKRILNAKFPIDLMRKVLHEILVNKLDDGVIGDIRVCRVLQECDRPFVEIYASSVTGITIMRYLEPRDSYIVSSAISKLGHLKIVDLYNLELNPSTVVPLANSTGSIEHFKVLYVVLSDELGEKHKSDVQKVLNKIEFYRITLNCTDDFARFYLACCNEKKMSRIITKHNKNLQDSTYKLIAAACPSFYLNISDNNLNENHVKQLLIGAKESDTKKLESLNIDENKDIKPDGFRPLVDFAKEVHLENLLMRNCNLNGEIFRAIASQAEGKELQLKYLDIGGNKDIKPEGFRPLVDFAKEVHLKWLSMTDCNLTGECFRVMANQVEGKELELAWVYVVKNRNVEPEGYKHFVDFLKHTRVAYLYMQHCELTTAKVKVMTDQLKARDVKLKVLYLNQDFPNPTKELLSCVCQLFHCVSERINLRGWKFSEDDLVVLKAELQKGPFKLLWVVVDHPSEQVLTREKTVVIEGGSFQNPVFGNVAEHIHHHHYYRSAQDPKESLTLQDQSDRDGLAEKIRVNLTRPTSVAKVIGKAGGQVRVLGCMLKFPRYAFDKDTSVSLAVRAQSNDVPDGCRPISPELKCNTSGVQFKHLATMRLPIFCRNVKGTAIIMCKKGKDRAWEEVECEYHEDDGALIFHVAHLCRWRVFWRKLWSLFSNVSVENHLFYKSSNAQWNICGLTCISDDSVRSASTEVLRKDGYKRAKPIPDKTTLKEEDKMSFKLQVADPPNTQIDPPDEIEYTERSFSTAYVRSVHFDLISPPGIATQSVRLRYTLKLPYENPQTSSLTLRSQTDATANVVEQNIDVCFIPEAEYFAHLHNNLIYRIDPHRQKGKVFIINNMFHGREGEREGSEVDVRNLQKLWRDLGFDVKTRLDLTAQQMLESCRQFATSTRDVSVVVVIIMSHGGKVNGKEYFVGEDGQRLLVENIISVFNSVRSRHLQGIPKVFMFQACRGRACEYQWDEDVADAQVEGELHQQRRADMLISFPTQSGCTAIRNTRDGGWFINAVTRIFMEHAHDTHVLDMLTMVNNAVARRIATDGRIQISNQETYLQKKLFLFPGWPH